MLLKIFASILLWLFGLNCIAQGIVGPSEKKRLHIRYINHPETIFDLQKLPICSNYGCAEISYVSFNTLQWQKILSYFNSKIDSAEAERAVLAQVIAYIEEVVGAQTNTQYDLGGTFNIYLNLKKAKSEQMDCVDESANTLLYLRILIQNKKINFHEVAGLRSRGGLWAGYPHTAVLLLDKQSKEKFIIDSWFHENGQPAEIVPFKRWKKGWKPAKEK